MKVIKFGGTSLGSPERMKNLVSLIDFSSLTYLFSFIFIAPLAYFVTQNNQDNKKLSYNREETLLWLTLELKQKLLNLPQSKDITKIIKHTNELITELEKDD